MKYWQMLIFLGKNYLHAHAYSRRSALIATQRHVHCNGPAKFVVYVHSLLRWKISLIKCVQLSVRQSDKRDQLSSCYMYTPTDSHV